MFLSLRYLSFAVLFFLKQSLGSKLEVKYILSKSNHTGKERTLLIAQVPVAVCADNVTNTTADLICRSLNYESGSVVRSNYTDTPTTGLSLDCPDNTLSNCSYNIMAPGEGGCKTGAVHLKCNPPAPAACPTGKSWNNKTRECEKCPDNTFSPGGHTPCSPCPPGTRSGVGAGHCELRCRFRQHWNRSKSKCVDYCPDVSKYGDGLSCRPCPADGSVCGEEATTESPHHQVKTGEWARVLLGAAGGMLLCTMVAILVLYLNSVGRRSRGCCSGCSMALSSVIRPITRYRYLRENTSEPGSNRDSSTQDPGVSSANSQF